RRGLLRGRFGQDGKGLSAGRPHPHAPAPGTGDLVEDDEVVAFGPGRLDELRERPEQVEGVEPDSGGRQPAGAQLGGRDRAQGPPSPPGLRDLDAAPELARAALDEQVEERAGWPGDLEVAGLLRAGLEGGDLAGPGTQRDRPQAVALEAEAIVERVLDREGLPGHET